VLHALRLYLTGGSLGYSSLTSSLHPVHTG
jgi:hypothetical protein